METLKRIKLKKVESNEIGFYLKLLKLDYPNLTAREIVQKFKEEFKLKISLKQIKEYENLYLHYEDLEKINRIHSEYEGLEHLIE